MNDFLSRLTGRSRGSAEVMRPRLASLFEPPPASDPGGFLERALVRGVALEERAPSVDSGPPPEAKGPAHGVTTRGDGVSVAPGPLSEIVELVSPSQSVAGLERSGELPRSRERRVASAPVDQINPPPGQPQLSASETESIRRSAPNPLDVRPALAPERGGAAERFPGPAKGEPEGHRGELLPLPNEFRPTILEASAADKRSTPVMPATMVRPRIPTYPEPLRLSRSQHGVMPEQTIHVTIGRVEVRATPSAVAPVGPRQRARPTPMSLDEYLERRARRGGK
jgi:hypothetical protein